MVMLELERPVVPDWPVLRIKQDRDGTCTATVDGMDGLRGKDYDYASAVGRMVLADPARWGLRGVQVQPWAEEDNPR